MSDSDFSRPTLPQLITAIRNDLLTRFDEDADLTDLRRKDAEIYSRVVAAATNTLYGYLDYLAQNMLPDLADEIWLSRHAAMKKCPRKSATAATGYARLDSVDDGYTIAAGVSITNDDLTIYTTTASATSANGILRVPVTCSVTGEAGNMDDGLTLTLSTPITGLSSSWVSDSIQGGSDIEGLEDWRGRVIDRWYYIPKSGADDDYVTWAKEVSGITRAWTYRSWMGVGTVGVMVANSDLDNPIPDVATVTAASDYIETLAPVAGSDLYVFAPIPHTINFRILLSKDTAAIRYAVTAELKAFLQRDGIPEGKLELSRIDEAISLATGEYSHTLATPSAAVSIAKNELAVLGAIQWT